MYIASWVLWSITMIAMLSLAFCMLYGKGNGDATGYAGLVIVFIASSLTIVLSVPALLFCLYKWSQ